MRLIDADALRSKFVHHSVYSYALNRDVVKRVLFEEDLDNAPTVEPTFGLFKEMLCSECDKRPQGEWIKHIDNLYPEDSTEECPFCHEEQRLVGNDDNFCPNCGADMRGGRP